jgi:ABC-type uncharacterized transport system permease subunit
VRPNESGNELPELLFWPALIAYAEAAVAYAVHARRPGRAGRFGTWGVRVGWLLQTGLLVAQTSYAERFPWGTWAGSLNLFVWLVVSAYLFWGCRAGYRLLGLVVMPVAVVLFALAYAGGGTGDGTASGYSDLFLAIHVGLVLVGLAGLTLAAALAGLYLWQERRLKGHDAGILRLRMPALLTLDSLTVRTIAVSLPALTLGIVAGLVRLVRDGGSVDALMAVTLAAWAVYGGFLALRWTAGWRGRRAAYLAVAGLALVLSVHFGLPLTHFS